MEPTLLSETTTSTAILGYGEAPSRRKKPLLILGIILGGLGLFVWLGWWGLRATFSIPTQTGFLIITTPKTALKILGEQRRTQLPPVWKFALKPDARFPVLLGAYREKNIWHHFAVIPRWHTSTSFKTTKRGLLALVQAQPFPEDAKGFRYTQALGWWIKHLRSDYIIWNDPHFLGIDALATTRLNIKPFFLYGRSHVLFTSLLLPPPTSPLPPSSAYDISFVLPKDQFPPELLSLFLQEIRIGDWPLARLQPSPLSIRLKLDDALKPRHSSFVFPAPLKEQELKFILASLGLTKRRTIQLPDGTLAIEQRLLDRFTPDQKIVSISGNEIRIGESPSAEQKLKSSQTCPQKTAVWSRFSSKITSVVLKNLGILMAQTPGIQLGSYKKKLVFCLES